MRAGLSTIQQTLTPEAANVLNHSIAEASRRNHGQTTPLHVAATLLASPTGFLRQSCIRSHPNSSHPLQCRALELCFSVALERLPTAQNAEPPGMEPPISNALMAALKRAQAHQRRGCPEQQQQPLLAVKVELEQLIISILDDPSVSRVMREASFSSPAVKSSIEQSLNSSPSSTVSFGSSFGPRSLANPAQLAPPLTSRNMYLNPRLQQGEIGNPRGEESPASSRNMYLNPRLQQGQGQIGNPRGEDVKKVLDIMCRSKKRNPVLVGDSEPEAVGKELLRRIENKEFGDDVNSLRNVEVISIEDKGLLSDVASKMEELGGLIESRIRNGGVILDLGNLKWLVEQPGFAGKTPVVSETGRAAVVEMTKLLARFEGASNKLWLIGTATCETYLRCQVYHSTMENDWDLQAVPIASRSPMFPRLGNERMSNNPMGSLNPLLKATPSPLTRPISENSDPAQTFCPQCSGNYEKELAKLAAIEKSLSEAKQDPSRPSLPQWLQNAKATDASQMKKDQGLLSKPKTQELQKKWRDTCLNLHPGFHQSTRPALSMAKMCLPTLSMNKTSLPSLSMPSLYNQNLLPRPPFQLSKLQPTKPLGAALQLNTHQVKTPPTIPVGTELVLGTNGPDSIPEDQAKDFLGCISSEPQTKVLEKFANSLDADTYKKLLKGLMEKAWWQAEAASAVASAITRCRLGNGKRRGAGSRGDIWLLFTGPDRVGKRKMASVLADQVCGGSPVIICLGSQREDEEINIDTTFRGKTAIDRIAEAVRRNPFSVIMLKDIDEADMLVRGNIKRAIERGRLTDSHGREVGLGNAVFVVTGDWSTVKNHDGQFVDEKKLASTASGSWQLGLIVREKSAKRRANWDHHRQQARTKRETMVSLDLNLAAAYGEDDSSDLTVEHGDESTGGPVDGQFSIASVPHELASNVDDSIVFKPVDSAFVRREIKKTIAVKFAMAVDENLPIEIGDDVLEKILGGLWHDRASLAEWIENVVGPSFEELVKTRLASSSGDRSGSVVRLVVESDSCDRDKSKGDADWLPDSILV